ncbi:nitroreductase/quinone reductase family protein [Nocardia higoensis]|uniref:nitroreductase/quinone reductase family protein n=1 Tax=Nocardia higoensis TaxID=228599 RepID=UPI00031DB119|nr:nitroreductase/quinone reductase family protein [Nocardia higoensis]
MSFDTANGTRGARQPDTGLFMRTLNKIATSRIKKNGKFFGGMDALLLTTVGRKTGVERTSPLGYLKKPDGTYLVVASAAGAPKNPAWYYNLAAAPDKARIQIADRIIEVTAEQLQGEERESTWREIVALAPKMGEYQSKTDRQLPVIRLTPRAGRA